FLDVLSQRELGHHHGDIGNILDLRLKIDSRKALVESHDPPTRPAIELAGKLHDGRQWPGRNRDGGLRFTRGGQPGSVWPPADEVAVVFFLRLGLLCNYDISGTSQNLPAGRLKLEAH